MEGTSVSIRLIYEHYDEPAKDDIASWRYLEIMPNEVSRPREVTERYHRKKFLEFAETSKQFFKYEKVFHRATMKNFSDTILVIVDVSLDQVIKDTPQCWIPKIDWNFAFFHYKIGLSYMIPTELSSWSKLEKHLDFKRICQKTSNSTVWNMDVLKKYRDLFDWEYIQKNDNIIWTVELLHFFSSNLDFLGTNSNRDFGKSHYKSAISHLKNVDWSTDLIRNFENRWNWNAISSNEFINWDVDLLIEFSNKLNINILCENKSVEWNSEMINFCSDRVNWDKLQRNSSVKWSDELLIFYFSKINPWIIVKFNIKSRELDFMKFYRKVQIEFDGLRVETSGIIDSNDKLIIRRELDGERSGSTVLLGDVNISKIKKNTFTISRSTHTGRVGKDDWYHDTESTFILE